jgi:leader peptidase (prepilin peptidase) / N-methyltransferase
MSIFFIFFIGLFIGSFLNVLADRLPNGKSILGRSHCEYCKHTLGIKDLFPLLSFLLLKGKCRYCRKKLSVQYPLSEVFTGVMFVLTYILVNLKFFLGIVNLPTLLMGNLFIVLTSVPFTSFMIILYVFALTITSVFIVIFLADLRHGIIPDKMLLVGIIATITYLLFINYHIPFEISQLFPILNHLFSALGSFLFFLVIYLLTRGKGIGFGDVKFGFLMGLILGFPDVMLGIYIAFLTGGIVAIILVLWKKKRMKSEVPFGPFLVLGTYVSFFLSVLIIPQVMALLS